MAQEDASLPTVTASQLRMEGEIAELVAGQQAATQTLLEVDKELEWLVASLGHQEPRDGIQAAVQRLSQQVQGLEGRGGTTPLQPGQDNEFGTVAALQNNMEGDVVQLSAMQRCLAEAVFEVYQEIARLNIRLGRQEGHEVVQEVVTQAGVVQGMPQLVQYQAPAQTSTVRVIQGQPQVIQGQPQVIQGQPQVIQGQPLASASWAPGGTFLQQAAPAVAAPAANLPTYGPPTTVVAPAQYMYSQPASSVVMEQATAASVSVPAEPMQTYSARPVMTQTIAAPVASPALPSLAPTTVVAAAQYMLPGSSAAAYTMEQQGLGGMTMAAVPVPSEPMQGMGGATMAAIPQPVYTEQAAATQTLPALAATTVVAPAQYMSMGPNTTPAYPAPVVTQSMAAAPQATLGAFVSMPGAGSMAVPSNSGAGAAALPVRGSLLKAGSITDDVFNMVDKNNDGVISRSEFRGALKGGIIGASANTKMTLQGHL